MAGKSNRTTGADALRGCAATVRCAACWVWLTHKTFVLSFGPWAKMRSGGGYQKWARIPALAGVANAHGLSVNPMAASRPGPANEPVACAEAAAKLGAGDRVTTGTGVLAGVGEVVVGDAQAANIRLSNPTMSPPWLADATSLVVLPQGQVGPRTAGAAGGGRHGETPQVVPMIPAGGSPAP